MERTAAVNVRKLAQMPPLTKLVVGCGYLGRRLAERWLRAGHTVFATTRSAPRADAFRAAGLSPILLDVTQPISHGLPAVDTLVFAVGYDRTAGYSIDEPYVAGLRRVIENCGDTVSKFIYISSTGVYGQSRNEWVNEESECVPNRASGRACLDAERLLRTSKFRTQSIILRLAGIYGPNRLPQADSLRKNQPLAAAADAYLNLIHVDDAVRIVARCDTELATPDVLCVSDGHPVLRRDFYGHLAHLLKVAPPVFELPSDGSDHNRRGGQSKRVCNDRLVHRLSSDLLFPTYREGLASILSANGGPARSESTE